MTETWSPLPSVPGYEISDEGRVRSVDRVIHTARGPQRHRGKVIKSYPNPVSGRAQVRIATEPGVLRTLTVAPLVLEAFVGPRPEGMEACHANDVPTDDRLANLRWDTHSENMLDIVRAGRHNHAGKTHCKNGHEFTERNTQRVGRKRKCRTCGNEAVRRYKSRLTQS